MLIELVGAGIICMEIDDFSFFNIFKRSQKCCAYAFDFAIRIGGKKDNFSIGRVCFQIFCKLFLSVVFS